MTTMTMKRRIERVECGLGLEGLPLGVPVLVAASVAQWTMGLFPLAGVTREGYPVLRVDGAYVVLWLARGGWWWIVRYDDAERADMRAVRK